ncbi:antibiotic biosynthesis monooxygenase family protein [Nocardia yamanashiensis]|uniref:antibiotic biosynthesis monooxygenase family protein n=1 Tax=Nocardia yamanashiensis TaxID=209247 RepID=UPI0008341801|nr:hypothetical protein [Nocardia yamanashiensis]
MFARSTTIHARLSAIDAGTAHVRDEILPALESFEGFVGLSLLIDRQQTGRCIVTTAWESEELMRASAARVRSMRDQAATMFGGSPQVEEWEIAVLHRNHHTPPGACVRAVWVKTEPDRLDAAIEGYKVMSLPGMEALEGFCSASLLVDRESGYAVSCATYDSADALKQNRAQATALRDQTTRQTGVSVVEVCEFELALAHLRVPELV